VAESQHCSGFTRNTSEAQEDNQREVIDVIPRLETALNLSQQHWNIYRSGLDSGVYRGPPPPMMAIVSLTSSAAAAGSSLRCPSSKSTLIRYECLSLSKLRGRVLRVVVFDNTYGHRTGKSVRQSKSQPWFQREFSKAVGKTYPVVPVQHHDQTILGCFCRPDRGQVTQVNLSPFCGHSLVVPHESEQK
jgi:hypothetical protein